MDSGSDSELMQEFREQGRKVTIFKCSLQSFVFFYKIMFYLIKKCVWKKKNNKKG